jgi:large subunit ribosomal protein L21
MSVTVEIAGSQFVVDEKDIVKVPLLEGEPGDSLEFDKILMSEDGNDAEIGTPYLSGKVTAKIVDHGRDDKVLVFHKKRRKGYRKLNGHRQKFSTIEITGIELN